LNASLNIRAIKSRRMGWVGWANSMWEMGCIQNFCQKT